MIQLKYTCGYKYRIEESYTTKTDIIGYSIQTDFIKLTIVGVLTLKKGFAWDGPSGIAVDTPDFMRSSAEHDAGYKLMRMGLLPLSEREVVDRQLRKTCLEDGMPEFRADYVYHAVRAFASAAANPKNKKQVFVAPANILLRLVSATVRNS